MNTQSAHLNQADPLPFTIDHNNYAKWDIADAAMESTQHTGYHDKNGMSRIKQDLKARSNGDLTKNDSVEVLRAIPTKHGQIHVGIVGAGFAGLRCADVLLQHGCKVTIFEARDRMGGRVAQSNHLGHLVDL